MDLKKIDSVLKSAIQNDLGIGHVFYFTSDSTDKPCAKVHYSEVKSAENNSETVKRRILVKLLYTPLNVGDYVEEYIEVREKFSDFFSGSIQVDDEVIRFENYKDVVEDNNVVVYFEFDYIKVINDASLPIMDSIEVRMEEE